MAWNNKYETKKFNKEQEKLAAKYRAVGMSEEAIAEIQQYDLDFFNSTRRFYEHNQQIPKEFFDSEDESQSPMNKKFLDRFSVTIEHSDMKSRYWWIEELEDPCLIRAVHKLSPKQLELITLYVYEAFTQDEVSMKLGISQRAVSKRINKLKNYFKKIC